MSEARLRLVAPSGERVGAPTRQQLGRLLVESGAIGTGQLVRALDLQKRIDAPLDEILRAEGWVSRAQVQEALARQHGLSRVDLAEDPPDRSLMPIRPAGFWLRHRAVPWMRLGGTLVVAAARPHRLDVLRSALGRPVLAVLAEEAQILDAIAAQHKGTLAANASTRVAPWLSCRTLSWAGPAAAPAAAAVATGVLGATLYAPRLVLAVLSVLAVLTLMLIAGLKALGFVSRVMESRLSPEPPPPMPDRLPKVSVLVPLYRETEIAGALVRRLKALTYPKALLDVILVLEEHDSLTAATLAQTELPHWMRVIRVPAHGELTTKPRAMNYALDFCEGEIVGVWDAEDAPDPDQIEQVVARFAAAPPRVACLQGVLDYYNPRTNWLARCFTIEYASWFRMVLPGIARLGLVVPLGGTTMFVRRRVLEELGGWDAHNVTEDADLGVRLARFGYATELIPTVTQEEANCRLWPWVKQRSRWLKGFMLTYLVHMRDPRRLWADLGARRFLGVQAFFLGTVAQFLLAPVLWSFWLIAFRADHPVADVMPGGAQLAILGLFLFSTVVNICVGLVAVAGPAHRHLLAWVPTLVLYYPLGAIAAYKALYEILSDPFYWDKTQHGHAPSETGA